MRARLLQLFPSNVFVITTVEVGAAPRRDQKQALSKDETNAAIPIGVQIVLAKLAEIQPNFKDALLFFPSMLCALARVFVPLNF